MFALPGWTATAALAWPTSAVVALVVMSTSDVVYRKVHNAVALSTFALGLCLWTAKAGAEGLWQSGLGALVVGAVLLPSYSAGLMGAGDVKAGAGVGALVAAPSLLALAVATLFATAAASLAALVIGEQLTLAQTFARIVAPAGSLTRARAKNTTLPFALCLSGGAAWAARGGTLWLTTGH